VWKILGAGGATETADLFDSKVHLWWTTPGTVEEHGGAVGVANPAATTFAEELTGLEGDDSTRQRLIVLAAGEPVMSTLTGIVGFPTHGKLGDAIPLLAYGNLGDAAPVPPHGNLGDVAPVPPHGNLGDAAPVPAHRNLGDAASLLANGNLGDADPLECTQECETGLRVLCQPMRKVLEDKFAESNTSLD
jgi:hypothetical protein